MNVLQTIAILTLAAALAIVPAVVVAIHMLTL